MKTAVAGRRSFVLIVCSLALVSAFLMKSSVEVAARAPQNQTSTAAAAAGSGALRWRAVRGRRSRRAGVPRPPAAGHEWQWARLRGLPYAVGPFPAVASGRRGPFPADEAVAAVQS